MEEGEGRGTKGEGGGPQSFVIPLEELAISPNLSVSVVTSNYKVLEQPTT